MVNQLLAVCVDCGDTLVDEGTEIKDRDGIVQQAELIPGAAQMVRELKRLNYPLALVADGPAMTFRNILGKHHLYDLFDAFSISEHVGAEKPDPSTFQWALSQLNIVPEDFGQVVMLGNNLSRDIKGANQLGMISVWLNWSPRRSKTPADHFEMPSYTITSPDEFISLLKRIESSR
jgi:putative hydrolase of the HAD superfamily